VLYNVLANLHLILKQQIVNRKNLLRLENEQIIRQRNWQWKQTNRMTHTENNRHKITLDDTHRTTDKQSHWMTHTENNRHTITLDNTYREQQTNNHTGWHTHTYIQHKFVSTYTIVQQTQRTTDIQSHWITHREQQTYNHTAWHTERTTDIKSHWMTYRENNSHTITLDDEQREQQSYNHTGWHTHTYIHTIQICVHLHNSPADTLITQPLRLHNSRKIVDPTRTVGILC